MKKFGNTELSNSVVAKSATTAYRDFEREIIMQYGLTAKTITRAKLKSVPAGTETDLRFVWEVNYTSICGKKLLLIVHADTRYCMVFCDIRQSVWKNLQSFLHDAVKNALLREGFSDEAAERYFSLAGEETITGTHGKKAIGGMNRIAAMLPYFDKILVDGMFQPIITDAVNSDLCTVAAHPEAEYIYPHEFFVKRISELLGENTDGY